MASREACSAILTIHVDVSVITIIQVDVSAIITIHVDVSVVTIIQVDVMLS